MSQSQLIRQLVSKILLGRQTCIHVHQPHSDGSNGLRKVKSLPVALLEPAAAD